MDVKEEIDLTRKIHKLMNKTFLEQCINHNIIPKGFKLKWTPTYNPTEEETKGYINIVTTASNSLIKHCLLVRCLTTQQALLIKQALKHKQQLETLAIEEITLWEQVERPATEAQRINIAAAAQLQATTMNLITLF